MSSAEDPLQMGLFATNRFSTDTSRFIFLLYVPIGLVVFALRIFLGIQTFIFACILRKTDFLRGLVLRVMCTLNGVLTVDCGQRDKSVSMMVANHVSVLDHMAVDILRPCILPSVWDIPNVLRWLFGYADLGARTGRAELIKQCKDHVSKGGLPLLAFPEGAMTNGRKALLKFSTWPFEVSDRVQPVSVRVTRLFGVEPTVLGAPWWQDALWFLFLPLSIISVKWLPVMEREETETAEAFCERIAAAIAADLNLQCSRVSNADAVQAARRFVQRTTAAAAAASASRQSPRKPMDPRRMDEVAMRIKKSFPAVHLLDIRHDLEKTKDMQATIDRIKKGVLKPSTARLSPKDVSGNNPSNWRRHFEERKWELIEENRQKYITRVAAEQQQISESAAASVASESVEEKEPLLGAEVTQAEPTGSEPVVE